MKMIRYYLLAALAALVATACEHKELCYDHTHTTDVRVVFDWSDAPEATPETMSLYLFPQTGGDLLRYEFTDRQGGMITVPAGSYDALCLNSDTERLLFRNMNLQKTFEVYTREANLLATLGVRSDDAPRAEGAEQERTVSEPDMLWSDSAQDIELLLHVPNQIITLRPSRAVRRYTVEIRNAENLKYVKAVSGSLSGMACGLLLEGKQPTSEAVTIPFAASATEDMTGIDGGLFSFGPAALSDGAHKLVIYSVLENGEKWYYTYDVTDQVRTAPDPYNVHILLDGLPLPKPLVNGGGFQPGIDGWKEIYIDIIL